MRQLVLCAPFILHLFSSDRDAVEFSVAQDCKYPDKAMAVNVRVIQGVVVYS